jgi:hypothetical protein
LSPPTQEFDGEASRLIFIFAPIEPDGACRSKSSRKSTPHRKRVISRTHDVVEGFHLDAEVVESCCLTAHQYQGVMIAIR